MYFKDWVEESLKIWSLIRDMIVGPKKEDASAAPASGHPVPVGVKADPVILQTWIDLLFKNPTPTYCTPAEDLSTKCQAVLSWIDDHVELGNEVPKDRAEFYHNHLLALKRDCEVRKNGLDDVDKMLAESTISMLKAVYTCKEPFGGMAPVTFNFQSWDEIIGDAKPTKAADFPIQEQDDEQIKGKRGNLGSPAVKVTERPATKKQTVRKPKKGKLTAEEKQSKVLAEVSDAVVDAHTWMDTLMALEKGMELDVKETIAEAEQIMLKIGSLTAEAVKLGVEWGHVILAEAEATFDELMAKTKALNVKLQKKAGKKKPAPKKKTTKKK